MQRLKLTNLKKLSNIILQIQLDAIIITINLLSHRLL